ncbi:enoyl-CoA hydratase/isomerase family protein [Sneathiella chinensis]|uniref:Enoyl-CoA hydratase n=1 Tax=Sneathiella chinensis TaxID=349750 RepID=A0ABQ5U1F5_9PROT|nr:enoyl-CoA hydratase/isomerase family protein [Sneathiella chinensis]GLQ05124.1 enoyl-CoA hydratase [Sneathiella chinensis]
MTSVSGSDILVERDGYLGIVTLNRPPHNFFSTEMFAALEAAFRDLAASPDCRAIVLQASGRSFCAGADFNGSGLNLDQVFAVYQAAVGLFSLPLPIVARIQGPAVGGGLGLALLADFRIAGPGARFSANFSRLGLHCGFGISATLPRVVGRQAAADLLLTGRRIKPDEAKAMGLVDRLVEDEALERVTLDFAGEIAAGAPLAVQSMRQALFGDRAEHVQKAVQRELAEQKVQIQTEDFREGVRAYAERRAANFTGR